MKNNFLPIPDAPGYEVNSQGFVRNIRTGKILKANNVGGKKKTPLIYIPKYHIRRTGESLRRQAVVFHKENGKNISWLEIPNFGGLYEINRRGIVRNSQTKKIKKSRQASRNFFRKFFVKLFFVEHNSFAFDNAFRNFWNFFRLEVGQHTSCNNLLRRIFQKFNAAQNSFSL